MANKQEIMKAVLAERVVPFYYFHDQRTFQMGDREIHIADAADLYQHARDGFLIEVVDLERHPVVFPQFHEPIALPLLANFLASTDTKQLSEEVASVMAEVHQDLVVGHFPKELAVATLDETSGKLLMDFRLHVHHGLHVAGLGAIGDERYEHGVFGYNFNNANDYPAQQISLYSGLGHIAALARSA